jgi:hypothetical protein
MVFTLSQASSASAIAVTAAGRRFSENELPARPVAVGPRPAGAVFSRPPDQSEAPNTRCETTGRRQCLTVSIPRPSPCRAESVEALQGILENGEAEGLQPAVYRLLNLDRQEDMRRQ